jgi:hypothetical protein
MWVRRSLCRIADVVEPTSKVCSSRSGQNNQFVPPAITTASYWLDFSEADLGTAAAKARKVRIAVVGA